MQDVIVFILIFAAILFVSSVPFLPLTQKAEIGQTQEAPLEEEEIPSDGTQAPSGPTVSTKPTAPKILVDTFIIGGPEQGEVIEEKTKITFKFEAKITPAQDGRIKFETKVVGLDAKWIKTSARERRINLPPGPKEYTFLVRAIFNGLVDPTPAKRTFTVNTSPYYGKIKIGRVQPKTDSAPSLITLRTNLEKEEEINVTGWNIKGRGGSFVVPGGIEKYRPGYNPVPTKNIFIKRSDIIYLSGGSNPLGDGRNFRPNKCLGYLTNYHDFPISFPKNCPKPTNEEISHLKPCCQEFILKVQKCEAPDYSNDLNVLRDLKCMSYLENYFNYASCFYQYSKDEDFVEKNWHIYMKRDLVVSDGCDTLYLRDQNGLFVDKFSYGRAVCR